VRRAAAFGGLRKISEETQMKILILRAGTVAGTAFKLLGALALVAIMLCSIAVAGLGIWAMVDLDSQGCHVRYGGDIKDLKDCEALLAHKRGAK
jgi:hypothetical protein